MHACMRAWFNEGMLGMSLLWHALFFIRISVLAMTAPGDLTSIWRLSNPRCLEWMERCVPLFTVNDINEDYVLATDNNIFVIQTYTLLMPSS